MSYQGPANGLYLASNPFISGATMYANGVGAPLGSLAKANNVQFTAANVLEPRRGNSPMAGATFGSGSSLVDAMAFFGADILAAYDLTKVSLFHGGSFTDFTGAFVPPATNRIRFENATRSIFFNAASGLWCWDGVGSVSGQPVVAGCPQGLSVSATNDSAHGWQTPDTAVAYRFTVCRKDAFGRIIEGPPSGRTTLRNSIVSTFGSSGVTRSGGATVHVTTDFPHGLSPGDVVTLSPGETNFPAGAKTVTSVTNSIQFDYAEAGANVSATVTQNWLITRSADLKLQLPVKTLDLGKVTTQNFVRAYRSFETIADPTTTPPTSGASLTPGDDMFLIYESAYLTSTDISNGYVAFSDVAPESTLAIPLYTNPNIGGDPGGALAARFRAPAAIDHCYFANRMWFANTTSKASLQLAIIGCGAPAGVQVGDTIRIEQQGAIVPYDYTAIAPVNGVDTSTGQNFAVFTDGDPGINIEKTTLSLVAAMNRDANFFYAFYVSADGGTPGQFLVVATGFGTGLDDIGFQFNAYSSRFTAWNPQLPPTTSPPFLVTSTNNRHPAGLVYSALGIPDGVPLLNFLGTDSAKLSQPVSSDSDQILRIFPLHYRLLIFKTDGIYFVTNTEPFDLQKMSSFKLIAPDSVALLDERVFCLTDQGIIAISDAGVQPISVPIDNVLMALGGTVSLSALKTRAFGVGYRTGRQYILWIIDETANQQSFTTDNAQALVYSTLSNGFTRYDFGARTAVVDPNQDVLILAPTNTNQLQQERKTFTEDDFFENELVVTVSGVVGDQVTLSSAAGISAGDCIAIAGGFYLITAVAGNVLTVLGAPTSFAPGVFIVVTAIACEIEFNPFTGGEPAIMKMSNQVSFLFRRNEIRTTTAEFHTEMSPLITDEPLVVAGWGELPWGQVPWGGYPEPIRRVQPLPVGVDNCAQLSVGFRTRQALAKFEFLGVDTRATPDTDAHP